VSYALLLVLLWLAYGTSYSLRNRQPLRMTLGRRLKAPVISSLLVLLSYFYPSLAFTVLSVFSCRYLDPEVSSTGIPGEVLEAKGWFWTQVRRLSAAESRRALLSAAECRLSAAECGCPDRPLGLLLYSTTVRAELGDALSSLATVALWVVPHDL